MNNPKVSVLMPVYNQKGTYLRQAIESIVNQTLTDFEFIIVDDGSTSVDCIEMLEVYAMADSRIQLIKNSENLGLSKTRNIALVAALCEYVAVQDSDDISDKQRLEKQVSFLDNNPEVVLVGSSCEVIDEKGKVLYRYETFRDDYTLRIALAFHNNLTHGSVMMRKGAVQKVGGYSSRTPVAEDYELYAKLMTVGNAANITEVLYQWRENPNGMSSSNRNDLLERGRMIAEKYQKSISLPDLATPKNWKKNWKINYVGKIISPRLKKRFAKLNFELAGYFLKRGEIGYSFFYLMNMIQIFPLGFIVKNILVKKSAK